MILSVTLWLSYPDSDGQDHKTMIQIVTDRIIKLLRTVYDPVCHYKDPVRHGMSYPDSDGQDHKLSVMVL